MESKHTKRFAVVILGMVAVMLSWLVFWPTNLSLPHQLIIPFNASGTFSMFLLCNTIIVTVILTTHFGSPGNSNGATTNYGRHCVNSDDHQLQMKFICNAEDADADESYRHSKSKKMGCRDNIAIIAMAAIMICSLVFWLTNLSLPHQLIVAFNLSHTFSMFLLCNTIVAVIVTTRSPRNSNGVTAYYDDQPLVFMSTESFCEQEILNSEDEQLTEKKKFICSAEDAGAIARYGPSKSEKLGCMDIAKYTENCKVENCSVSLPELMQLVEVPAVIHSKSNELASMIDGDFNRTVEEFIAEFKRQLHQQSISRRRLQLAPMT